MSGHSDEPRIVIVKNGPSQVTGNVPLDEDDMVIGEDGEPVLCLGNRRNQSIR